MRPAHTLQGYTGKAGNKLAPTDGRGGNSLLAGGVIGATFALPILFCAAIFLIAPGRQLPFNFLDGFYGPRVEEVKMMNAKKAKVEAAEKAAKDKVAAAAAEKIKAAAEAEKAAAAAKK